MLPPDKDRLFAAPKQPRQTQVGGFASTQVLRDTLPVLIVLHGPLSTPGRVGNALRALGHPLDIRRPVLGDALPDSLEGYAGAVMFGGPMSANDSDAFIHREIDWLAVPLKEHKPFLGICLGA